MTQLPWTFSRDDTDVDLPELRSRLQDVFDSLTQSLLETGNQSLGIRAGSGTLTWPGGAILSNTSTVTHGLGITPIATLVTTGASSGVATFPGLAAFSPTSTQFSVRATTVDGTNPLNTATTTFYWVAIG